MNADALTVVTDHARHIANEWDHLVCDYDRKVAAGEYSQTGADLELDLLAPGYHARLRAITGHPTTAPWRVVGDDELGEKG